MTAMDRLNEITERTRAATDGPWEARETHPGAPVVSTPGWGGDLVAGMVTPADAEFIAHSRADLDDTTRALSVVLAYLTELRAGVAERDNDSDYDWAITSVTGEVESIIEAALAGRGR